MAKRYSSTYRQLKTTPKSKSSVFSIFGNKRSRPRRVRSESDRASAMFGNPYSRSRRQIKTFPKVNKKSILFFALSILVASWLGIMFFSPFFDITKTKISGLKNIKDSDIQPLIDDYLSKNTLRFFHNSNFFVASEADLIAALKPHFFVDDIQVTKTFPNQLNIDIQEKLSSILYDNGNQYVLLDQNGTVIKSIKSCTDECATVQEVSPSSTFSNFALEPVTTTATSTTKSSLETPVTHSPKYDSFALEFLNVPIVYDTRHKDVAVGNKYVLLPEEITTIESIATYARKNHKNYNILYFVLNAPGSGVEAITDKPYRIYFNLENDLTSQFEFIKVVLKNNKPSSYIDVRYANRVFWK